MRAKILALLLPDSRVRFLRLCLYEIPLDSGSGAALVAGGLFYPARSRIRSSVVTARVRAEQRRGSEASRGVARVALLSSTRVFWRCQVPLAHTLQRFKIRAKLVAC